MKKNIDEAELALWRSASFFHWRPKSEKVCLAQFEQKAKHLIDHFLYLSGSAHNMSDDKTQGLIKNLLANLKSHKLTFIRLKNYEKTSIYTYIDLFKKYIAHSYVQQKQEAESNQQMQLEYYASALNVVCERLVQQKKPLSSQMKKRIEEAELALWKSAHFFCWRPKSKQGCLAKFEQKAEPLKDHFLLLSRSAHSAPDGNTRVLVKDLLANLKSCKLNFVVLKSDEKKSIIAYIDRFKKCTNQLKQ